MDEILRSQMLRAIDDEFADMESKIGGFDLKTGEFTFGDDLSNLYDTLMRAILFVPLFVTNQLVKYNSSIPKVEEVDYKKWRELAAASYQQGDLIAAIVFLENFVSKTISMLEQAPQEEVEKLQNEIADACYVLSQCFTETDDSRAFDMYVVQCRKYNPNHLDNLLQIILRDINAPRFADSFQLNLDNFIKWISLHPSYSQYKEQVSSLSNDAEQLVSFFETLQQKYSKDETLCYALALLYNGLERLDESAAMFTKLTEMNPEHYTAWNKIAASHCNNENYELALEYCDKALAIRPNYVRAISNKAIALYHLKRYEEALDTFVKALELYPVESNDSWDTVFTCAFKLIEETQRETECEELMQEYDGVKYNLDLFKIWLQKLIRATRK